MDEREYKKHLQAVSNAAYLAEAQRHHGKVHKRVLIQAAQQAVVAEIERLRQSNSLPPEFANWVDEAYASRFAEEVG